VPAGIAANLNVITAQTAPANMPLLWVINDVQNHGTLASDPYWFAFADASSIAYKWAWYNNTVNVRHGFIIGINGIMNVADTTGLAYVAGALNQVIQLQKI